MLENANDVINMRIVDLAASTEVSEPTVIGFAAQSAITVLRLLNYSWHSNLGWEAFIHNLQSTILTR